MAQKKTALAHPAPVPTNPVCGELHFHRESPATGIDSVCYSVLLNGHRGIGTFASSNSDEARYVADAVNNYAGCVAQVHELKEEVRKLRSKLRKARRVSHG